MRAAGSPHLKGPTCPAWLLPSPPRAVMPLFFGEENRAYMRRVPSRYFTLTQARILGLILMVDIAGLCFR